MSTSASAASEPRRRPLFGPHLRLYLGAAITLAVVALAVLSQFWTPHSLSGPRVSMRLKPPLEAGLAGTDAFGRDIFSQLMVGAWNSLSIAVLAIALGVVVGVALGTLASTFWIMSANSWMQTPAGYTLQDGIFHPANWWQIVFNPSFPVRLVHMALAAFLCTAFMIGGISAWYLLRGRFEHKARFCLKSAVAFVALAAPLQVLVGDINGQEVRRDQPAKLAALEGHWQATEDGVPLVLWGVPNERAERNDWELSVPRLGSLILTHSWDGQIAAITDFKPEDRPPVAIPFYAFRIMVGLGVLMVAAAWWGLVKWRRGTLFASRWYLRSWIWMMPSGFIALLAGWWVAEVGRQPWVVYGLLRTADAASDVPAGSVLASLIVYVVVYVVLFGFVGWYLLQMLRQGPVKAPERQHKKRNTGPRWFADDAAEDAS